MHTATKSHLDRLRRIPGQSAASYRQLVKLSSMVDEVALPKGSLLTRQGARDRQAFLILDGRAEVIVDGTIVAEVGSGDYIGEMGMLDHGPRSATVRAVTPIQALIIGPHAFWTFVGQDGVSQGVGRTVGRSAARYRRAAAAARPLGLSRSVGGRRPGLDPPQP